MSRTRPPSAARPLLVRGLLCATCLVGGALAGVAASPVGASAASAAPVAATAADGGGLDPSHQQRATSMMPADSVDGARLRAAARSQLSPAVSAAKLQPASSSDVGGIDVSSYQHPGGAAIGWASVRGSGIGFAFVKATESTGYVNPYFTKDVKAARAAGIDVGGYHFARPAYSATAQADAFAAELRTADGNLPPVLDLEDNGGLGVAALQSWTATFLTRVRADVGMTPIVYTGPYFWADDLGGWKASPAFPLWIAQYTTAAAPDATGAWTAWTFWQWTDGAYFSPKAVPGVAGTVDRDRFSGPAAQLTALAAGSSGRWLDLLAPALTGRALSTAQLNTYVHDLARGASRPAVAVAMQRTTAGVQTDVRAAFQRLLGRAADPAGLAAWTTRRGTGGYSELQMVVAITESQEFLALSHTTLAGFITRLYQVELGRTPSAADIATWSKTYAAHGRNAVAYDIGFSPEAIHDAVEREYEAVLARQADPAGLASWGSSAMRTGTRWEALLGALYGSTEYAALHNVP